ncbi:MAG: 23S rRNA pseudouridine(1911/1915/1917) synthase RluD [Alcanivoracaceae bacterium]
MGQPEDGKIQIQVQAGPEHAGQRLDQVATELFGGFSRARLQEWIKSGSLTVNGEAVKPKQKLVGSEQLVLDAVLEVEVEDEAEPISIKVVFEDDHLLVIDKPAGLVVHPAAGHAAGTLLNGLLHHNATQANLPRAGIVHRLDRDTTGLMVVAKTLEAHASLVAQLQDKSLYREYEAVVQGVMTGGGKVDAPVGRHPTDRKRMAVIPSGKPAVTHYRVTERFRGHTLIRVQLETGRTHQIRVHMTHIRYPLVGDPTYGRLRFPAGASAELRAMLHSFSRQALHARRLGLIHPETDQEMMFESPLPADFEALLATLRKDRDEA